jgi:hypothetical protein
MNLDKNYRYDEIWWQNTLAAQYKAWVCSRLLVGIMGSNPAGDMDVCLS